MLAGVQSQIRFDQSGPELRRIGEQVTLTCKASGYTFTSYAMNWIRQKPGKGLEWVGDITTDNFATSYAKALEGRAVITVDISVSTTNLQMANLKAEDTAVYYCARYTAWKPTSEGLPKPQRKRGTSARETEYEF
uniref:Uncharacterized protein n=1 Tax=Sphaerodactylus townsendi TaxID=933632 RepID=A0ACB8EVB1_9SAUR